MESEWRRNVYAVYGTDTGFQLFAWLCGFVGSRGLLKESNTRATVRDVTVPGPDGFGAIVEVLVLTPADRFPYGRCVEPDSPLMPV